MKVGRFPRTPAAIRPLSLVRLWSRDPTNCRSAVAALASEVDTNFEIAPTAQAAIADARDALQDARNDVSRERAGPIAQRLHDDEQKLKSS